MDGEVRPHYFLPRMAADYVDRIRDVNPEGPYLLIGSCFGGVVVYEMAHQLMQQGLAVPVIAILDTQQPPNMTLGTRLRGVFRVIHSMLTRRSILPQQSARRILAQLTQGEWFDEDVRNIDRVFLANSLGRYLYASERLDGTVHLFLAEDSNTHARQAMWQKAARRTEVTPIPGDHAGRNSFMREPHVREVASRLNELLAGSAGEA